MAAVALTSLECVQTLRRLGFRITTTTPSRVVIQDPIRGKILTIPRHRILSESELGLILLGAAVPIDLSVKNLARGSGEMPRVEPRVIPLRLAKRAG